MTDRRSSVRALLTAALLLGCVPTLPGGAARAARTVMPTRFDAPGEGAATSSATVDWRTFFRDPHLVALITTALANNQELNLTVQETLIARNEVMARRGEYRPSLSVGVGAGLDRVGRYTSQGQADEANGVAEHLQNYSARLYASWEVDIWGRLRNNAIAANQRYLATVEGQRFVVTRLVAEIATKYYELLALDRRLAFVRSNVELQRQALDAVRVQQQAARVTMLAVRRFEAQLQGFQSRQFEIQQRIVEVENEINFLCGRFPQPVTRSQEDLLTLEPPTVQTGAPGQLLENRPDVRQAELALAAASLDVRAVRARFYPALRLDAGFGYQSFDVTRLLNTPDSLLYNLFAGVMAPLLNRSGITAEYFSANSREMQAVLRYERAILAAYLDVNTGLHRLRNITERYALQREQVARLSEGVEISTLLFNSARADYLEVLTTRRDFLEAQMDLIETKERQLAAAVTLYQALGGGWRPASPPDPYTATTGASR
jgi:multidrug efflux system outer membrane protein